MKNKKLILVLVIVGVLLLLFCGCGSFAIYKVFVAKDWLTEWANEFMDEAEDEVDDENDDEDENSDDDDSDSVSGDYEIVVSYSEESGELEDDTNRCVYSGEMPYVSLTLDGESIESDAADAVNEIIEDALSGEDTYELCDYALYVNEGYPTGELFYEGTFNVTASEYPVLSMVYMMSFNTGGAHPGSYVYTFNFNMEDGTSYELGDLFANDGGQAWDEALWFGVVNLTYDQWGDELYEGALQDTDTPPSYQLWFLTDTSIVFLWEPYDIAPYASGSISVDIPFNTPFIVEITKEGGPIDLLTE